jgi:hypothetical protein
MRLFLALSLVVLAGPLALGMADHADRRVPPSPPAPHATPSTHHRSLPRRKPVLRLTVIGDSVADEITYVTSADRLLRHGVRLNLQLAACRRLVEPSCTVAGIQPPTALQLIQYLGPRLGPNVAVSVGYNDDENLYRRDVERVLAALREAGVRRVLWLNLRAERHPYLVMNDALRELATADPQLTLVDWNRYSRSHRAWFGPDGLHLTPAGAIAMARLLHKTLTGADTEAKRTR